MAKFHLYDKILFPLVTEKSTNLQQYNQYSFIVSKDSNSLEIKSAIEKIFKVNVIKVNIVNKKNREKISRGKKIKIKGYKKAILFCSDRFVDFSVTTGCKILSYKCILFILFQFFFKIFYRCFCKYNLFPHR